MSFLTEPRTDYCGALRAKDIGRTVLLKGWIHRRRDHGGLLFIDLRDREGLAQVILNPEGLGPEKFEEAHSLRDEFVLAVRGKVIARSPETVNPKLPTGEVEVKAEEWEILNPSRPTPFKLDEFQEVSEEARLRYRFLDLRRPEMQRNFIMRSRAYQATRNFLTGAGFIEFETPILTKSTPEGARDFLVPSRMTPGTFYALPQSPQLFKQLLMVAGYDRYFQIARCFRDEDFRANRQPEFTQIDIEMSFITVDDLIAVMEGLVAAIWKETAGIELKPPFRRMSYADAMSRYGSDKPDLRFGLEIHDVSAIMRQGCQFQVFTSLLDEGGVIRAICLPGGGSKYSNTALKPDGEFNKRARVECGVQGIAWFRVKDDGSLESNIAKFFAPETLAALREELGARPGDMLFLVADKPEAAAVACGRLRLLLARENGLISREALEFCWILDFPMFEWDAEEKRWNAMHHPFTAPRWEDIERLESDPGSVRAQAYDLALNGEEIGGGSIRIHRRDIQEKVFKRIGLTSEDAERKFGFLLDALSYGAPPHGGLAFGFDRIMMIILGEDSIRNVIPFPKTQSGVCLMTQAPSEVDAKQLKELGLRIAATAKTS